LSKEEAHAAGIPQTQKGDGPQLSDQANDHIVNQTLDKGLPRGSKVPRFLSKFIENWLRNI
jgi:hypothetical protein